MQSIWLSDFHPGNLWATGFGFGMIGYQVNVWQICNLLWLLYYPLMKTGSTLSKDYAATKHGVKDLNYLGI